MRRSFIRLIVALAVLAGGAAVFSRSATTSVSQAVADRIVAPQAVGSKPASPTPAPAVRLSRQSDPRVCKALDRQTQIEFVEAPLQDVVDFLKDLHNLEIQIDAKALEDASVGPDSPVTCNLKGVSLGAALDLLLKRMDLTYVVEGEVLMITAESSNERRLSVRLHDCAFVKPNQMPNLIEVLGLIDAGGTSDARADQKSGADASRPVSAVAGFKVVPYGSWLAVRATTVEHETVRRLLAELRSTTESNAATTGDKPAAPAETRP